MVLNMSRPVRHPKTGIFWLRKRVPVDVEKRFGRKIVTKSLGTRDPEEAKRAHSEALLELEGRWAALRRGSTPITDREAHFFAQEIGARWLADHRDNPSEQFLWHPEIYYGIWSHYPLPEKEAQPGIPGSMPIENVFWKAMRNLCFREARTILATNGFDADILSLLKTAKAVGAALQKASLELQQQERGEFAPGDEPQESEFNSRISSAQTHSASSLMGHPGPITTLSGLIDGWWKESKAAGRKPSTYESYRNTFASFIRYLGHDNATQVSAQNVIGFKDHRLSTPSPKTGKVASAKTVKDSDLSALKAVFDWAVRNGHRRNNPAANITIKLAKPQRLRSKGFTDSEAKAILAAAFNLQPGGEQPKTFAAKRWIPWLSAFTGARVGELAQLRKQDVIQRDGRWIIRITPEAGTVKTNEAREVPIHQQIVELGFPAYVSAAKEGHLFLNNGAGGDPLGPLRGLKNRLAAFGRSIVLDPAVAPNHGWRHRFKTIGMEAGIPPRILDAIQGQAPRSVADTYGEVTIATMAAELAKLPRYDILQL